MKRFIVLFGMLLASVGGPAAFAQEGSWNEGAVKQVITAFADAWNKHDVAAMMALHTPNVNFTRYRASGGEVTMRQRRGCRTFIQPSSQKAR